MDIQATISQAIRVAEGYEPCYCEACLTVSRAVLDISLGQYTVDQVLEFASKLKEGEKLAIVHEMTYETYKNFKWLEVLND